MLKTNEWGMQVFVEIPILEDDGLLAITDKENNKTLRKNFANVHSGSHLDDIHRQKKEDTLNENKDVFRKTERLLLKCLRY